MNEIIWGFFGFLALFCAYGIGFIIGFAKAEQRYGQRKG